MSVINQSHSDRKSFADERRSKRAEEAAQAEHERTVKAGIEHRKALKELESDDKVEVNVTQTDDKGRRTGTKKETREKRRSPRAEGKELDSLLRASE